MTDVVCAMIQDSNGSFLACLRPQGKHLAGLWEFPGGKVKPEESSEAALVREMQEELGVLVQVGTPLEPVVWSYDRGCIRLLPYFCTITHGQPQAIEHEQLLWCAPADFGSLSWAEADLPVLAQILARQQTKSRQSMTNLPPLLRMHLHEPVAGLSLFGHPAHHHRGKPCR